MLMEAKQRKKIPNEQGIRTRTISMVLSGLFWISKMRENEESAYACSTLRRNLPNFFGHLLSEESTRYTYSLPLDHIVSIVCELFKTIFGRPYTSMYEDAKVCRSACSQNSQSESNFQIHSSIQNPKPSALATEFHLRKASPGLL